MNKDWTFNDASLASNFDSYVRDQLPWYDLASSMVEHFGRNYIPVDGLVYDLGASTGNVRRCLGSVLKERRGRLIAVEQSEEMARMYPEPKELIVADAMTIDFQRCDFVVAFLFFMFLAPKKRKHLFDRVIDSLEVGGAMLFFDKFLPSGGHEALAMSRLTLSAKMQSGVPASEILDKEMQLSGIQRPLYESEVPLGSVKVFQFGDFSGYLFEKK